MNRPQRQQKQVKTARQKRNGNATYQPLEPRNLLATIVVSTAAEFVDALATAASDPMFNKIEVAQGTESIELSETATYEGTQKLAIDGNGATVRPVEGSEGSFDLFKTTGGSNLALNDIVFANGLDGVLVEVPVNTTGQVSVKLSNVNITGSSEFGLHIDDLAGSPASIKLEVHRGDFVGNGVGALDFDGIRVDERGNGSINAFFKHVSIDGNGGDGLELDEGGSGNVRLEMHHSSLNENGFFNSEDLDDGLDIDETGPGSVSAVLRNVQANDNLDEGIDLDEEDQGAIKADFRNVSANGNFDEGIKFSEAGSAGIRAIFSNVSANGNGDDGIELEEEDGGNVWAILDGIAANQNGDEGIQVSELGAGGVTLLGRGIHANHNTGKGVEVSEDGSGSVWLVLSDSSFDDNGSDGIEITEQGAGSMFAAILRTSATGNDGRGIDVLQENGVGRLLVLGSDLSGNVDGRIRAQGVDVFGDQ